VGISDNDIITIYIERFNPNDPDTIDVIEDGTYTYSRMAFMMPTGTIYGTITINGATVWPENMRYILSPMHGHLAFYIGDIIIMELMKNNYESMKMNKQLLV
jgi:hypothetical protein